MKDLNDGEILRKFASKVRNRRHVLGLSQMRLAELINCHINSIGKIERAQTDPSLLMMYRLSQALEIPIRDLLPDY